MYRPYTFPTFTYFNIIKLDDPKTSPPGVGHLNIPFIVLI